MTNKIPQIKILGFLLKPVQPPFVYQHPQLPYSLELITAVRKFILEDLEDFLEWEKTQPERYWEESLPELAEPSTVALSEPVTQQDGQGDICSHCCGYGQIPNSIYHLNVESPAECEVCEYCDGSGRNYAAVQQTLTFVQSTRCDEKHIWYAELNGYRFMIMVRKKAHLTEYVVGFEKPAPFGYVVINSDIEPVFNRTRYYSFDDAVKAAKDYYQSLTQACELRSEGTTGRSDESSALFSEKSVESASNTHTKRPYAVLNADKGV